LTKAGVVGARFAPVIAPEIDERLVRRAHEFGWAPHFFVRGEEQMLAWRSRMLASPGNFVIEHSGWQPVDKGVDSAGFRVMLECLDTGRCWVKLSPRFTGQKTLPFADVLPFIHALVARAPERCLWGSDWPHPNYFDPMPNDADLLDLMFEWVPDEAVRNRILADNPAQLFGFPPP
jgi:predicted TIM-barrel fold metal-dependent hydrolase